MKIEFCCPAMEKEFIAFVTEGAPHNAWDTLYAIFKRRYDHCPFCPATIEFISPGEKIAAGPTKKAKPAKAKPAKEKAKKQPAKEKAKAATPDKSK